MYNRDHIIHFVNEMKLMVKTKQGLMRKWMMFENVSNPESKG